YLDSDDKRANINAQKFVGIWYLISVITDVKLSSVPKCIVWNVKKEHDNNIFNIKIYEGIPSNQTRHIQRRFHYSPIGDLDLIDETTGHGESVHSSSDNSKVILKRKDRIGYLIFSRRLKGFSKKLHHDINITVRENNWVYTIIDQVDCSGMQE
ncbi:hypothetical protein PV326_001814, partial [Microctonus aethiopoides]